MLNTTTLGHNISLCRLTTKSLQALWCVSTVVSYDYVVNKCEAKEREKEIAIESRRSTLPLAIESPLYFAAATTFPYSGSDSSPPFAQRH